jgi:hypothetical protein
MAAALAALVLMLATGTAAAQLGIGQVNGTVFGADHKGVPGLPVAVVPQDGRALYGTSTDPDGRYALKGMPPGTYSVLVGLPTGVVRKDGIRIRPLFRSIVDFNVGGDTPGAVLPGLHATVPAPATLPAGSSSGAAPAGAAAPAGLTPAGATPGGTSTAAVPVAGAPAAGSPLTASSPAEADAASPSSVAADTSGTTATSGIAMSWTLQGPERSTAPDAWVAAIPAQGAGALRRGRTDPQGGAELEQVPAGQYHLLVRAPGFMTWRLGPVPVDGSGTIHVALSLVPYPMGFPGTLEDQLIPADPIPLEAEPKGPSR